MFVKKDLDNVRRVFILTRHVWEEVACFTYLVTIREIL